jgi:hypothetical protein
MTNSSSLGTCIEHSLNVRIAIKGSRDPQMLLHPISISVWLCLPKVYAWNAHFYHMDLWFLIGCTWMVKLALMLVILLYFVLFQNHVSFWCLFDRHCPYVLEAITALAELGATVKDIISLFPQVCWWKH